VPGEVGLQSVVRETIPTELHEPVAAIQLGAPCESPREPGTPADTNRQRPVASRARLARTRHSLCAGHQEGWPNGKIRRQRPQRGRGRGQRPPQLEVERDGRTEQIRIEKPIRTAAQHGIFGRDHRPGPEGRDAEPRCVDPEREGLRRVEPAFGLRPLGAPGIGAHREGEQAHDERQPPPTESHHSGPIVPGCRTSREASAAGRFW